MEKEYISNTLSHFVGRSLNSDEDRYNLLIKIINDGQLLANVKNPDNLKYSVNNTYLSDINGELFTEYCCVCFCDIPEDKLSIHTNKYSKFGIGFEKNYLVKKGCRPVMYVPENGRIQELVVDSINQKDHPALYFSELRNRYSFLNTIIMTINSLIPFKNLIQSIINNPKTAIAFINADTNYLKQINENKMHSLLYGETVASIANLAYVKLFDPTLSESDPNNYYYEREWRSIENIDFTIGDITTIYVPDNKYVEKLKRALPEYAGRIVCITE